MGRAGYVFGANGTASGEWEAATVERRHDLVAEYVESVLMEWLGNAPSADERDFSLVDLGLDSLLLVEISGRIRRDTGADVPIAAMLEDGAIGLLEEAVLRGLTADGAAVAATPEPGPEDAAATESPLSHGQQALWLVSRLGDTVGAAAYNVAFTARVAGGLDRAILDDSVRSLMRRHPVLRSTFSERDSGPVQIVQAEPAYEFTEVDASGWSQEKVDESVRTDYARPFALGIGPLLRVSVYRIAGGDCVLLLAVHHLVCDFWSLSQMLEELSELYQGRELQTPAAQSYGEFVRRQQAYLDGDRAERARAYWHERLSGELPVTAWPAFQRTPQDGAASIAFRLEPDLADRIRALAQSEHATMFMVLVTAFQLLINRYTGQDDVIVGTPVAGRTDPDFDECVGYFVNPVALRADLGGEPTFRALLGRARQLVAEALEHQDYPFEQLVRELAPRRLPGVNPIFQSMFVYQRPRRFPEWMPLYAGDREAEPVSWGGRLLSPFPLRQQEGQHDLLVELIEDGDRLYGVLKYHRSIFSDPAAERAVEHYRTLLRSIVAEPDRSAAELSLFEAQAPARVLPRHEDSTPDSVLHRFEQVAAIHADRAAVRFRDTELTYRELDAQAARWAAELRRQGVRPGDRVALLLEPSLQTPVAILAVLKAHASYIPLDPLHPAARLQGMLADCGAGTVLTQQALTERLSGGPARVLTMDTVASGLPEPGELPGGCLDRADLIYTIYTSGSTGAPKGVDVEHGNALSLLDAMAEHVDRDPEAVWTLFASIAFDVSVFELWGALLSGACLVVVPAGAERAPDLFLDLLAERGVTHLNQTPSALHGLVAQARTRGSGGLALQHVFACGEILLPELALEALGLCGTLWNVYGPTEITMFAAVRAVRPEDCRGGGVPVGSALANSLLYVLDAHRRPVPPEVAGELWIGGLGVSRGYLNRAELTAERFVPDPFDPDLFDGARMYRTGDVARFNADGLLEILGRADNQVKISGFRVELEEVEAALEQESAIFWSAVVVEGEGADDRRLTACVVPRAGQQPTEAELRASLSLRLPPYMVPGSFVFLDQLPLSSNRKVDRAELVRQLAERRADTPAQPAAGHPGDLTDAERTVAVVWEQVLRRDGIGAGDNFFDLGGDSMLLLQVHRRLGQLPDAAQPPVSELFRHPTLAGLARRLYGDPAAAPAESAGLRRGAARRAAAGETAGAAAAQARRDRRQGQGGK